MGYELRRAIRDAIPPDALTLAERLILLELADFANDASRLAYPGLEALARAAGVSTDTASKCLQRIAAKGLELRVEIGRDRQGRAVFAAKGHQTTYRLPDPKDGRLSALAAPERTDPRPAKEAQRADHGPGFGVAKGGPTAAKGRTHVPQRADHGPLKDGPPSAPSPQEPSLNTSTNTSGGRRPARPKAPAELGLRFPTHAERMICADFTTHIGVTHRSMNSDMLDQLDAAIEAALISGVERGAIAEAVHSVPVDANNPSLAMLQRIHALREAA